ncbi:DEAD/DEAH box helicase family protein [Pseudolactococcus reticulitermitis]|uniref:Shikimate kinase n=1 Tax=Pseudolactococcus reticulitermitis TaxID=2025039 RepID=A0A224X7M8_9LACT|nr:hypothetical protein [Lactococcus reticulitermitis]GAX48446.1 hypothetical protein RsY01_2069 [Lactococcus reticulitermitis]
MSLVVLIGAQAVGKMTVGRELEKQIDGKLLYNHQTIDLFANFLGYTPTTFQLSDELRKSLFQSFVNNLTTNPVNHLIFTVMIDFASDEDLAFLSEIAAIFLNASESVYFVELVAEMSERRVRNTHPERLAAKPSKRDLAFSMQDLEQSAVNYQLESKENQLAESFPEVQVLKIDNSHLSPETVVQQVLQVFPRLK